MWGHWGISNTVKTGQMQLWTELFNTDSMEGSSKSVVIALFGSLSTHLLVWPCVWLQYTSEQWNRQCFECVLIIKLWKLPREFALQLGKCIILPGLDFFFHNASHSLTLAVPCVMKVGLLFDPISESIIWIDDTLLGDTDSFLVRKASWTVGHVSNHCRDECSFTELSLCHHAFAFWHCVYGQKDSEADILWSLSEPLFKHNNGSLIQRGLEKLFAFARSCSM